MKLFSLAALLVAAASTIDAIVVNTPPSVVECQPLLITWDPEGSAGPFFLSIVPGGSPSSPALFSWSDLTGDSFTWIVTEPAGTSLGLLIRDQTGATSQSAAFTVQSGTTDCLTSGSSLTSTPVSSPLPSLSSSSEVSSLNITSTSSLNMTTTTTTKTTSSLIPTTTTTKPPTYTSSSSSIRSSTASSTSPSTSPSNISGNTGGGAVSNAVNFGSIGFFAVLMGVVLA